MVKNLKANVETQLDVTNKKLLQVKGSNYEIRFNNTEDGKINFSANNILSLGGQYSTIYITATDDVQVIVI